MYRWWLRHPANKLLYNALVSIRESNCIVHWIKLYLEESVIHLPNKWPSCVHGEIYYLHVISCENNLCVRSGKDEWSQRLRFDCLGGLIDKNMGEESMQNLQIQKHLWCTEGCYNNTVFNQVITWRQYKHMISDQTVFPRYAGRCFQPKWTSKSSYLLWNLVCFDISWVCKVIHILGKSNTQTKSVWFILQTRGYKSTQTFWTAKTLYDYFSWPLIYSATGKSVNTWNIFKNSYCVKTNHSKDQNMLASHETTN